MELALTMGGTFVARGFAGEPQHLSGLIQQAIRHPGYALVDVLQPCVVFNRINTYDWYRQRVYKLEETGHQTRDLSAAQTVSREWGDRIPISIIYREEGAPTYEAQLPALGAGPLVRQPPLPKARFERLKAKFR